MISGTGSLTKSGAGTLTLTGANTYSGGTTVSAGTLAGNATSLQGSIVNNAIVSFNQAAAGTYAGSMSGTGSLAKSGAGTLILSGVNSYTGGTTLTAGTLQGNSASLQGNIAASNTTVVVFDQAAAGTYSGVLSGAGSLTKTGAGTLTLTGVNTYTGGTRFNGGTIAAASDARLGTGALTFNGGALQTLAAFNSAKAVSLLGVGTIDTNGFAANLTGAITGVGSLVKNGAAPGRSPATTHSAAVRRMPARCQVIQRAAKTPRNNCRGVNQRRRHVAGVMSVRARDEDRCRQSDVERRQHVQRRYDRDRRHSDRNFYEPAGKHSQQRSGRFQSSGRRHLCEFNVGHRCADKKRRRHADTDRRQYLHGRHHRRRRNAAGKYGEVCRQHSQHAQSSSIKQRRAHMQVCCPARAH